ncbi:MAG: ABC transporter ATP-binding protein [Gemmatimonadetes bacterium]|nr:ABC transporter ATP-binding protein [Gemmatimonadota bacterium]
MTDRDPTPGPLLEVRDLVVLFDGPAGVARAVDGVSFDIARGETVALVGESGCGKSVTALSLLRLIDRPGRIERGSAIRYDGRDLLDLPEPAMRALRGNRIAMIFQEPATALNPVFSVGDQVAEVARIHDRAARDDAWARAVAMLKRTGIPDATARAHDYPHQLSGGMRQRVMIAMALMMGPTLIIADEPTTALDVTIQAQILDLLRDVQRASGSAVLLITHDLGIVAEMAQRVLVMYGGEIVESAPVRTLFARPAHPYTSGLLRAMPRRGDRRERLDAIPGTVPPATAWPGGCRFRDRCPHAWDKCAAEAPALVQVTPGHAARCHLVAEPRRRIPATAAAPA